MAETAALSRAASKGSEPFARRARVGSLFDRVVNGKPATKVTRLTGMLLLLALGGRYLVPATEMGSSVVTTLATNWGSDSRPVWQEMEEQERRRLSSDLCIPNASDAATGYRQCIDCFKSLTPKDQVIDGLEYSYPKPVALGARCYCKADKTCHREELKERANADNPCRLWPAGHPDLGDSVPGSCMKSLKAADCSTSFPSVDEDGDAMFQYVPLYLIVILYCFLGLAIVCDELFVPALEIMAEKMALSNDVAGATLMAAGGSAPELATSLIGTFQGSDVGMGTIVGSAVFNVLFVIGMCAMATPPEFAPLKLTWWPLARDCSYYLITLISLWVWFSMWTPGKITAIEALIQLGEYFGYVLLMKYSEKLEKYVKSKLIKKEQVAPADGNGNYTEEFKSNFEDPNADFLRPSTFRTGIYQLLTQSKPLVDTAGIHVVTRIKGDVLETFKELDKNGNGMLDKMELKALFQGLSGDKEGKKDISDHELDEIYKTLDLDKDNKISYEEFTTWYTNSETRLNDDANKIFDELDQNQNNHVNIDELKGMLNKLGHHPSDEEINGIIKEVASSEDGVSKEDFLKWYKNSLFWTKSKEAADDAAESQKGLFQSVMDGFQEIKDPEMPMSSKVFFIATLPLTLAFSATVPDCRPVGKEWLCWLTFFLSICWIGAFTYPMVECATALGSMFSIPVVIMGLTFLAAGTSVPDLLSSVIVAKQGQGDMAVSSSIGSNIFDVAVGLPLPWLMFNLFTECEGVCVGSGGIVISLSILIAMVFLVIVTIAASGWKMTRTLGMAMFGMYVFFCLQDIIRTFVPPFKTGPIPC